MIFLLLDIIFRKHSLDHLFLTIDTLRLQEKLLVIFAARSAHFARVSYKRIVELSGQSGSFVLTLSVLDKVSHFNLTHVM